jgi:hypothetical protein
MRENSWERNQMPGNGREMEARKICVKRHFEGQERRIIVKVRGE